MESHTIGALRRVCLWPVVKNDRRPTTLSWPAFCQLMGLGIQALFVLAPRRGSAFAQATADTPEPR